MAQAARLNLRMQKELKLLLSDPPPGASFPSLSADSSASSSSGPSLSSIEAQIEGPEGTVYANGFFKLKIQIPERYPFQPPIVTFATRIYHPNIDNGGRICLDILNLPPKGAWQPSLNISTVLTSIGLLLSEPNPDDGLMHEASQEYKYNRQVFDQKARSMTEKYARIGACEIAVGAVGGQDCQTPSLVLAESKGADASMQEMDHYVLGNKGFCGIRRKLSLESSGLDQTGQNVNAVLSEDLFGKEIECKRIKQELNGMPSEQIQSHQDPQKTSKKLSIERLVSSHVKRDDDKNDLVSTKGKSTSATDCSESLPLVQSGSNFHQKPNERDDRSKCESVPTKLEKEELLQTIDSKSGTTDDQERVLSVAEKSSTQCQSSGSHKNFSVSHTNSHQRREPHNAIVDGGGNGPARIRHKKLGLAGRHFSSGMLLSHQCKGKADTKNLAPISSSPPAKSCKNPIPSSCSLVVSEAVDSQYISTLNSSSTCSEYRQPLKPLSQLNNRNTANTQSEGESLNSSKVSGSQHHNYFDEKLQAKEDCVEKFAAGIKKQEAMSPSFDTDEVIVLDSEESDEDQKATTRSKLSLARRRFPGKLRP